MKRKEPFCKCGHPVSWHDEAGKCSHGCGCERVHGRRQRRPTAAVVAPRVEPDLPRLLDALAAAATAVSRHLRALATVPAPVRPSPATSPRPKRPSVATGARGERRLLAAIAQHPNGVTREQLMVLTGYRRSSRDTYLQRLRSAGLVTVGDRIVATTEGAAVELDGALRRLDGLPELGIVEERARDDVDGALCGLRAALRTSPGRRCGKYVGDNDGTCPQLTCIRERGHTGLCDNVSDSPDHETEPLPAPRRDG